MLKPEKLSITTQLNFAVLNALIETASEHGTTNSDRIYYHLKTLRNNWLNLKMRPSNDDLAMILGTVSRLKLDHHCLTEVSGEKGVYRIDFDIAEEKLMMFAEELIEAMEFEFNKDFNISDLETADFTHIGYLDFPGELVLTTQHISQLAYMAYEAQILFNEHS